MDVERIVLLVLGDVLLHLLHLSLEMQRDIVVHVREQVRWARLLLLLRALKRSEDLRPRLLHPRRVVLVVPPIASHQVLAQARDWMVLLVALSNLVD